MLLTERRDLHVAEHRCVFTYEPDGWPGGIITGVEDEYRHFHVEHVIVFPRAPSWTLWGLLHAGIAAAVARGYHAVWVHIPEDWPGAATLRRIAVRFRFHESYRDQHGRHLVRFFA